MSDTTFEEAKRCPRCEQPGEETGNRAGPLGSRIHTFTCKNNRCKWYTTSYVVQVNADGTIPDPTFERPKNFPKLPERTDEEVERLNKRLYEQTVNGGETR